MIDTIITKLIGGLGNQMFQYATALSVSKFHNAELILDLSELDVYKRHNGFELDKIINLECKLIRAGEVSNSLMTKMAEKLSKKYKYKNRFFKIVKENSFNYNESIYKINNNFYMSGYWQSAKYFESIKNILINNINFKKIAFSKELELKIKDLNSLGIHIRRGDYVTNRTANLFHGTCNYNYYYNAIDIVSRNSDNLNLFIFSDDIENVKNNFIIRNIEPSKIHFVDQQDRSPCSDLYLLKSCKHKILANSSFSWWAAYLNNDSGITIAPNRWFRKNINTDDLYLNNWIKI